MDPEYLLSSKNNRLFSIFSPLDLKLKITKHFVDGIKTARDEYISVHVLRSDKIRNQHDTVEGDDENQIRTKETKLHHRCIYRVWNFNGINKHRGSQY